MSGDAGGWQLIDEYVAAVGAWAQRMGGRPEENLAVFLSLYYAGVQVTSDVSSWGLKELRAGLRFRCRGSVLSEAVLVAGLVRVLEAEWDRRLASYGAVRERNRHTASEMRAIANDPERFRGFARRAREFADGAEPTRDDLLAAAAMFDSDEDGLTDMRDYRQALLAWCEITAPLTELTRLSRSIAAQADRAFIQRE